VSAEPVAVTVPTSSVLRPEVAVVVADDLTTVLHQAGRAAFGVVAVATEVLIRALVESTPARVPDTGQADVAGRPVASDVADVVLGLGWRVSHWADAAAGLALRAGSPVVALALDPPLVPHRLRPRRFLREVAATWVAERPSTARSLAALSASLAPVASDVVGSIVDQQRLWLDLNRVLDSIVGQLDLDHLVTTAMSSLDLEGIIRQVIDGLDVSTLIEDVLRDTDLSGVADVALEQLDLTTVILEHVDMERLVPGIVDKLDVTALVLESVDLDAVAHAVLDGLDLPQIVRESSAGVTSETVDTVRLQAIDADRAVARIVDRLLMRRGDPR